VSNIRQSYIELLLGFLPLGAFSAALFARGYYIQQMQVHYCISASQTF